MTGLKIRHTPDAKPILPSELLDAARRAHAQVDGRGATDLTAEDVARRDAFARAFIGQLPADLVDRLAHPETGTWEARITTALKGIFTGTVDSEWITDGDREAFRVLISKIEDAAKRGDIEPIDVLRTVPERELRRLWLTHNPAATLANLISG